MQAHRDIVIPFRYSVYPSLNEVTCQLQPSGRGIVLVFFPIPSSLGNSKGVEYTEWGNYAIFDRDHRFSQCSTLVRNTVVRAILRAYGKWWISTPGEPKLLNRLRWNLAWVLTSVTPSHLHKTKSVRKGGSFGGGGEMLNVQPERAFLVPWTDLQLTR